MTDADRRAAVKRPWEREIKPPDWTGGQLGDACALCGEDGADVLESGYALHHGDGRACWALWIHGGYRVLPD